MPSCIWESDQHRDVPRPMWFLPPSVLCCDFLSLTSVFAPSITFTASLCLSCRLHLLLPSVFVLLIFNCAWHFVLPVTCISDFFLSQFYLLQHTVFMPPGSKFIAAHGVCTFVPPVWFIAALSLCTASLNHRSTTIVLYCCLGICTAVFICLHPFSCIDAHIFSMSFIYWCPQHFHCQFEFIAAPNVCATSLNSSHCCFKFCPGTFLCYCLRVFFVASFICCCLWCLQPHFYLVFCAICFIDCYPWHLHCVYP